MNGNQIKIKLAAVSAILGIITLIALNAGGGNLEPNAPPDPTMHSLEDIYNVVTGGVEPPPQPFAYDGFLKIDGIEGESTDDKHAGWIEVLSYSHGISHPRDAGRADHQDFSIVKELDKSSPKLNLYCCAGSHIPYIQFNLRRAGEDEQVYMEYKMTDAIICSVQPVGPVLAQGYSDIEFKNFTLTLGGESLPLEEVTFNYGMIEWTYIMSDGNSIYTGWDVDANTPIDPCGFLPSPD